LKHHPDFTAQRNRIDVLVVDVFPVEVEVALDPCGSDEIVHPVDTPQERRFPASGGTDHCRDLPGGYLDVDVVDCLDIVVIDAQAVCLYDRLLATSRRFIAAFDVDSRVDEGLGRRVLGR